MANGLQTQPDLDETLFTLFELLLGKRKALDTKRQGTATTRGAVVTGLEQPVESREFFDPESKEAQAWVKSMFGSYSRMAMKNQKDVDEVIRERLQGKNPFMIMLGDTMASFMNPQAKTVREKLFKQEMMKRQLRGQQMNAVSEMLKSLGLIDVQRQGHETRARGQAAQIEGQGLVAQDKENQSTQDANEALVGKGVQSKLDMVKLLTGKEVATGYKREEMEHQAEVDIDKAKKLRALGLWQRTSGSSAASIPKEVTIARHPAGNVKQYMTWDADTREFIPIPGFPPLIEDTTDRRKARADVSMFFRNITLTSQTFAQELEKNPKQGLPTKLALADAIKPLFGIAGLFDVSLPKFLADYERTPNQAEFLRNHFNQVLNKVREISGQQVTNTERIYVTKTLPDLMSNSETYGMGMELARLWTGWRLAMANESVTDEEGLTKLTEKDEESGVTSYRDYTAQIIRLQQIAEQREKVGGLGSGAKFLAGLDAMKPWKLQAIIDKYNAPALENYRRRRQGGN